MTQGDFSEFENEFDDDARQDEIEQISQFSGDLYGIQGIEPESWKEVGKQVNGHLKKIAVDVFGLLHTCVSVSASLLRTVESIMRRGSPEIQTALADRVRGGQQKADAAEESKQQPILNQNNVSIIVESKTNTSDSEVKNIENVLSALRAKGL